MTAASENTSSSLLAKLRHRLAQTTDSEPEQAINIRLTIGFVIILYFCVPWGNDETFLTTIQSLPALISLGYYFGALLIVVAILINPKPSPLRRTMAIILDITALSIVMFLAGEKSVIMFVFYPWIILGMGFRYGMQYLYFSLFILIILNFI